MLYTQVAEARTPLIMHVPPQAGEQGPKARKMDESWKDLSLPPGTTATHWSDLHFGKVLLEAMGQDNGKSELQEGRNKAQELNNF